MVTRRELSTASRGVPTVPSTPEPARPASAGGARTPAWLPALLGVLALALVAGSALVGVRDVQFEADAEYGWVVVRDVGDGSVTAVQDLDPEGPTITLDVPTTASLEAGSRIAVRYDADSPYDVVLADRPSRLPLLLGAGLVGIVLAGIAVGLALRVRRARAQLNPRA